MKTLFGYAGKIGSGKAFKMLKQVELLKTTGHTVLLVSFADPLKKILREGFGLTKEGTIQSRLLLTNEYAKHYVVNELVKVCKRLDKFEEEEEDHIKRVVQGVYETHESSFYSHLKDAFYHPENDYSFNFRRCAQLLGTELGRGVYDKIWVETAFKKVKTVFDDDLADYAFIDDVRFFNEYESFLKLAEYFQKKNKDEKWYECQIVGVYASDETRAKRRGLTLEEMKIQDAHDSERDIDEILKMLPSQFKIDNN